MPGEAKPPKKAGTGKPARAAAPKRRAEVRPLRDERLDADVNEILEIVADAQRAVDRQLKSLARRSKLSPRGIYTLSLINAGLDRPSLLVDYFDSIPSTMTLEVDRLVAAKLVTRKTDTRDRRIIRLELTKKGNSLRESIVDTINDMFIPRIDPIDKTDLRACVDTLKKIVYTSPD